MNQPILSAFKRYNANSRDLRTPDCVKRSISLALAIPYDDVAKQLRDTMRAKSDYAWNIPRVYETLLTKYGVSKEPDYPKGVETLQEFCDKHPAGTYLVAVDSKGKNGRSDHLVCVINGDIYDSWDSTNSIVYRVYDVPDSHSVTDEIDVADLYFKLKPDIEAQLAKLNAKYSDILTLVGGDVTKSDLYTLHIKIKAFIDPDVIHQSKWYGNDTFVHMFTVKVTPRGIDDAELARQKKSILQKIYDWVYNIAHEINQYRKAHSTPLNPRFRGDKIGLMNCPDWAIPLITYYSEHPSWVNGYKYYVYMEPLPDDPRAESASEVVFRADTLSELKWAFQKYKEDFRRIDYDY